MSRIIRRVRFTPYIRGLGPTFNLVMWDTGRRDWRGTTTIGYALTMRQGRRSTLLFRGEGFNPSPLHAVDSDAAVDALMSFLTLRPGDTDAEYFRDETEVQAAYRACYAEALACEALNRFGRDDDSKRMRREHRATMRRTRGWKEDSSGGAHACADCGNHTVSVWSRGARRVRVIGACDRYCLDRAIRSEEGTL